MADQRRRPRPARAHRPSAAPPAGIDQPAPAAPAPPPDHEDGPGPRAAPGSRSLRALVKPVTGRGDAVFQWLVLVSAVGLLALTVAIFYELFANARPLIVRDGLGFVFTNNWDVQHDTYGAAAFIFGTLVSSAIAVVLATPVALGVALYLTEVAPTWLRRPVGSLVELLAAVPSVAFGFWGIFVLKPWMAATVDPVFVKLLGWTGLFAKPDFGISLFTAGLVLAIMILPIIAALSREIFTVVPSSQREAAFALGATKWEAIRMAVLPYARSGIIGGVVLGLGRAMGEAMAVVFVIGNVPQITRNLLAPGASITSQIANTFAEVSTTGNQLAALLYLALVLFFITLVVNIAARLLVWRATAVSGGVR
jgi:phosphate transport system permease protein